MLWVLKKTRLYETVLLDTQNLCYNLWIRKYLRSKDFFINLEISL